MNKPMNEHTSAQAAAGAMVARNALLSEYAQAEGYYVAVCTGPVEARRAEYVRLRDRAARVRRIPLVGRALQAHAQRKLDAIPREQKWTDDIHNVVTTEGKNANLTHFFSGSAYTATAFMGLIESTGYGFAGATGSGVAATNTAANITAVAGASPANGWNEATTAQCAARGTPSFAAASAGSRALSSALAFSILANATTIKGCFMMARSVAGVAAVATTGSTAGMIYSAGLFTGGDKVLANGDTLSVSYTASL